MLIFPKLPRTFILLPIFMALIGSCTSSTLSLPFGMVPEHAGYVPARVSVVPCMTWPEGARFQALPLSNTEAATKSDICKRVDTFVIDGFKDQPYMRGFSPTSVQKLLEESNNSALLNEIPKLWANDKNSCVTCATAPAFYVNTMVLRAPWLDFLGRFSKSVRNADAVLIPFVSASYEKSFLDRGLAVKQRGAAIVLLLIDTNNGNLLWSGGRESLANNQSLQTDAVQQKLEFPSWDLVYERLLTEDVWRDFPGRQIFR